MAEDVAHTSATTIGGTDTAVSEAHTFHLVIASVGQNLFDSRAKSVTLPGAAGVFTILAHHEPVVATLKQGTIMVKVTDSETKNFDIESGVVECSGNRVVVLL